MKETCQKQQGLVLYLLFFILLVSSCSQQDSSGTLPIEVAVDSHLQARDRATDTALQLEFSSMVRSIFEDSKGNLWFGSDQEGVCRYDGKSFTYFTTKDGLCDNQIRTIQEDAHGRIWFATGNGLCSYYGNMFSTHTVTPATTASTPETATTSVRSFKPFTTVSIDTAGEWKNGVNDLWFNGEREGGIYRYDGQRLSVVAFPLAGPGHASKSISGTVTGISKGNSGMLWLASYSGVMGFDGKSFTYITERALHFHVRAILEDSKGTLWIGNNGSGVLVYDGKTTVRLSDKMGLSTTSPVPTHVFAIAEDQQGNIWFGDRDTGAWRYDGNTLTNYTTADGLTSRFVRVIYRDKKDELWFGLSDGSVCKFNGKSFDKVF